MSISTGYTRRHFTAFLAAALLSGCRQPPPAPYAGTPRGGGVRLGVTTIDVVNDHRPAAVSPFIDHLFYPTLAERTVTWARETLVPADDKGNLLVTITRAAMSEHEITSDDGLKSLFTSEQRLLVKAELAALFSFAHPVASRSASMTVTSSHEMTIADDTTPARADAIRARVMDETITRFDQEFRAQLAKTALTDGWPQAF